MTDSELEAWKPIPGYPFYEASEITGRVRSVPREAHGRTYRGVVKATRVSNSGYALVDVLTASGRKETRTVHSLVLLAFAGPCPEGQEARHLNGNSLDNRAENLAWGTKAENTEDMFTHGRPRAAGKPPKVCPRCGTEHHDPGRRCHACVTEVGEEAARLLAAGVTIDEVAERLAYPSLPGVLVLACKYGGLRLVLAAPEPPPSRSAYGAIATLRDKLRRGHHQ